MKNILIFVILCISCNRKNVDKEKVAIDYKVDTTYYTEENYKRLTNNESLNYEGNWLFMKTRFEKPNSKFIPEGFYCDSTKYKVHIKKKRIENDQKILYKLSNREIFEVPKEAKGLQLFVEKGFLDDIIYCRNKQFIFDLSELKFLETSENVRRYMFLINSNNSNQNRMGMVELKNDNADRKTSFVKFIEGATVEMTENSILY
ncbi:hypothetical protein LX97_01425 [Nonlabens dokdonensis]|jgi:hypothetical protein|uniref:Uncharacterized protein n=2 Tax=Nonlabens dokdonensis TaxID=328515 RepID=L7WCY9_NONDD|nr:hypothetical protein [Nonlabens dokdonensis]AGC76768.1 hypothetical protein DDD_1641 [Nonlabens dokdonensis DSW-6]PZX44414.1 hypothetical protein LX97_01425 [Nonlabens dokdonensis]